MDVSEEITAKNANPFKGEELLSSQHIKDHGRSNSPPWKKVLVYDCREQTLTVQREKNISWSSA